jgi:hypothetical protein
VDSTVGNSEKNYGEEAESSDYDADVKGQNFFAEGFGLSVKHLFPSSV